MYKLDLPVDQKEAAIINNRRSREEQRQSRIFNSKIRQIGIDKQALAQQVKDKKERECIERNVELAYAADAMRNDSIATLLGRRQLDDIRELNKILNEFRSLHQQPETRREWDLYDPDALKKDKPARVCDDDPRCGLASMQKFDGEDLNNKARNKYQKGQVNDWNERQMADKERAEQAQREADRLYDLKRREMDERACNLAAAEEACRRAMNIANSQYNLALAREMNERARLKNQQENDDTLTAIANALYSDLLTENPAQAISAFGPGRIVPDRFKGMTPEQLKEIFKEQEDQIKDNKYVSQTTYNNETFALARITKNMLPKNILYCITAIFAKKYSLEVHSGSYAEELKNILIMNGEPVRRQMEEDLRNKEWDRQRLAQAKAALVLEKEEERKMLELSKHVADENLCLSKEQKLHQEFLNREVYTNQPTAAYFMQFNTTSR